MRIETYEQGTGKKIQIKELDYETGEWKIYDEKRKLMKKEKMSKEEIEKFNEKQKKNRESDFKEEADPLFLKYNAGEIHKQVWLDKREEIRSRHKYILESIK